MTLHFDKPQPKQIEFMMAQNRFVGYGGARGGGKSWAVRMKAQLLALNYSGIKVLILRRTFPELRENHILPLRTALKDVATYKDTDKRFTFPNGSAIIFGYCATESDVLQYQGQEYDIIFLDEATQFTEFQFATLTACMRGANGLPKRMYLTCNPGGVGHAWVKRLFIDCDYKKGERPEDYVFIKALVDDNKALVDADPDYVRMLDNLPTDELRRAWRYGEWDVFVGQYFTMWKEEKHILDAFPIPAHWGRFISMDYGMDMLACYWYAVDESGFAYAYKEVYKSGLLISEAAEEIKKAGMDGATYVMAPPDLWNRRQDTGKSAAEIFAECGVPLVKSDNRRIQGWYDMAEWLRVKDDMPPALRIFRGCCPNLVRCLPMVQIDAKRLNDIANEPHELTHSVDAVRYFCAGRPLPSEAQVEEDPHDEVIVSELQEFLNYGG